MFPQKLQEVVYFLNKTNISISENNEDGRVNSTDDEKTIINVLEEKYGKENIVRPQPRNWWDVKVFEFPIQLKSSDFKKKGWDKF